MHGAAKWTLAVLGVCVLTPLLATWSLAAHLTEAIPLGVEREATVPVFSLWTLWWTADRAAHGFHGYWNAPIFHPIAGAFSFSEPQILAGLLVAPLWPASAPPALIYNLALLALLGLNGWFGIRLARALDVPWLPALLAGAMTVTLPVVANHLGVLPVVPVFGMLWTLEGLVRFGESGSPRSAAWAAAGFFAQFLASQQLALLFSPFAVAGGIVAWSRRRWQVRPLAWLAAAALVALLLAGAIARPGRKARAAQGFQRSGAVVYLLSASPRDFLLRPPGAVVPIPPPATADHGDTAGLFPGVLLIALAALGAASGLRARQHAPWMGFLLASAFLASLLALGLKLEIADWQPFATLRALVPVLAQLRGPYRFAVVQQVCLPPLAACGLATLARQASPLRQAAAVTLGLLAAAENLTISVPLQALPTTPRTAWSQWLRTAPAGTVIAHVPFPAGLHVSHYESEVPRLFAQIDHRKPMVNGYSSFFPPAYTALQIAMIQEFPSPRLLCALHRDWRVNTLVVDQPWLAQNRPRLEAGPVRAFLRPLYSDGDVEIYRLIPPASPASECPPLQ